MLRVTDFKKKVKTIFEDSSIAEAAALMSSSHVGDLIVVDRLPPHLPTGIVSDHDIVNIISKSDKPPKKIHVSEVMSTIAVTVGERDDFDYFVRLMRANGVGRVPIVDESGVVTGVISGRDLLKVYADEIESVVKLGDNQLFRESSEASYAG